MEAHVYGVPWEPAALNAVNEAHAVAQEMRDWMKEHRWLRELDGWAARLEEL